MSADDLLFTSGARAIARSVNRRERSAADIAEAVRVALPERDRDLGAYLTLTPDLMRQHARRVDARIAAGETLPLAGVPVAIKDNMCLRGTRTTCGSKMLENWIAPYTATAVGRLLAAGAIK